MASDPSKQQLVQKLRAAIYTATGRSYHIDFDALDAESIKDFLRLLHDLEQAKLAAVHRARFFSLR